MWVFLYVDNDDDDDDDDEKVRRKGEMDDKAKIVHPESWFMSGSPSLADSLRTESELTSMLDRIKKS